MRRAFWVLVAIAACAGAVAWWAGPARLNTWLAMVPWLGNAAAPAPTATAQAARRAPPPPVVSGAAVRKTDLPVTIDALGTVQGYNSVVVATRVDGQLIGLNFTEGQEVKQGDVLALVDPRTYQAQLDQALAKLAQDRAQLENAKRDLERYGALVKQNFASGQQYDTARSQVLQYEANVKSDEASVQNARVMLSYTTIAAPISGRLGLRQVDVGNIVRASDTNGIVSITQLQPISIVFTVPQQRLPEINGKLRRGDTLVVFALGIDGAPIDQGRVEVVDNQIDQTTGTIKLKAVFPNAALALWPGGFANVRLQIEVLRDSLVIPTAAVQYGPEGPFAYVVKEDGSVDVRPLVLAHAEGERTAITSGVAVGETVIVGGQERLRNGSQVTLAKATETGPAGPPPATPRQTRQRGPAGSPATPTAAP